MERKYMRKNNLSGVLIISFLALFVFTACAQEHSINKSRLAAINAAINTTVLLNNQDEIVPIISLDTNKIASVNLGYPHQRTVDSLLNKYTNITSFSADQYKNGITLNELEDDLKFFHTVLISIAAKDATDGRYLNFINSISSSKKVIISLFGDGKSLPAFDHITAPVIWSSINNAEAAGIVPQIIFGGIAAKHHLTHAYSPKYTIGSGFTTEAIRLKYTVPEDAGVNSDNLREIDKIVDEAIKAKAAPGMVVLVAKDGKVIFNKAYGTHTYDQNAQPERIDDIFDLASVTKTTATTPAVMRLVEEKQLKLDTNVGAYIPLARLSPMNNIQVREVMLHQAGFIPFIPFQNFVKPADHSKDSSATFPTKVADGYYVRKGFFKDFMWPKMLNSPIKTRGKYVYSDISMYVMKDMVERVSLKPIDQYVMENFYAPLGMKTAGFNPRNRFDKNKIVPTEKDTYFRDTLLVGYVHDQGAALVGGISGHAGLFSSANDMAIFYQMMLNKGTYGGQQYFKPETVNMFTQKQSNISRRGLGFDRSDPDTTKQYPSELASSQTFGHTGYTGTCVWVDPSRGLVYVFLSNRVNPGVSEMLGKLKIRGRIQDVINKAIDKKN